MFKQIFLFLVTTVVTAVITVLTEKLVNHWFNDNDDE